MAKVKFTLNAEIELDDPDRCEGCRFECENECGDMYCAATEEGRFLSVSQYDAMGKYIGILGTSRTRPNWCPLTKT